MSLKNLDGTLFISDKTTRVDELIKATVQSTIKDLYWSAGFLEGEGSFICLTQLNRSRHKTFRVNAGQVNKEPLEKLRKLFGGSIVFRKARIDKPKWNDFYVWEIRQSRAVGVALTIFPLLSQKRKDQIRKALDKYTLGNRI